MQSMKIRIKQAMRRQRQPISIVDLGSYMGLQGAEYKEFENTIPTLIRSGEIIARRGKLTIPRRDYELKDAQVVKVNATFGFVRINDSTDEVFVPGRRMMGAMPGDEVQVKVYQADDGRFEGEISKLVAPANYRFTGVVVKEEGRTEIVPDKSVRIPITVRRQDTEMVKAGDKVLAELDYRGATHFSHTAQVLMTFGSSQSAKSCCDAILAAADIHRSFPEEVEERACEISAQGISPKELESRMDLRELDIFTIDSADTKDIDDAISLQRLEDGWRLGVHIADVSHYVTRAGVVDCEAFERGTSVYFANSVVPMLPAALSNGICSLNQGEERLAFSALMHLDKKGELLDFEFQKTVIRSRLKGVYKEINAIYDQSADEEIQGKYAPLLTELSDMRELSEALLEKRDRKGGLDLESVESKIVIGEDGICTDIIPRERGYSEQMIEEFMLLANEAAATFGVKHQLPFLFRVHDVPTPEKLETLKATLDAVGISSKGLDGGATPKALFEILQASKGTRYQKLVNNTLLRSMAKAKYSENNIGHFGLVLKNYSHFTSPIRRYPDLMIHRIMSDFLSGMKRETLEKLYRQEVAGVALQSSNREVRAMTTERDCEDCYKAEYMLQHLGEELDGVISGVAGHGIYVELPNTVEGLIRNDKLPEGDYEYDGRMTLTEKGTGKTYRVGDPIRVQVLSADVSAGNVDFGLSL